MLPGRGDVARRDPGTRGRGVGIREYSDATGQDKAVKSRRLFDPFDIRDDERPGNAGLALRYQLFRRLAVVK
jgi:hypothetical protein